MKVYTNGTDKVVAESATDAVAVMREFTGEEGGEFCEVDPSHEFSIYNEVDFPRGGKHSRGCPVGCPTKTAAQWAQDEGRGFLCSTEF